MADLKGNFNKLRAVVSVIFLGAIGSGLWEVFLKDIFVKVGGYFVSLMTAMYSGYIDRLYERVGAQSEKLESLPSFLIIFAFIMSPFVAFFLIKRKLSEIDERYGSDAKPKEELTLFENFISSVFEQNINLGLFLILLPLVFSSLLSIDLLIVSTTNSTAIRKMERNLEIIRPYTEEVEYYKLQSEFRMINSRDKYQKLFNSVKEKAVLNSVRLPDTFLYGIK